MADKKKSSKQTPFWARVQELLDKPRRQKQGMNLSRLSSLTSAGQTVVVADKILGAGELKHAITVAAPAFSQSAKLIIAKSGGSVVSLEKLQALNPAGKDVRILI